MPPTYNRVVAGAIIEGCLNIEGETDPGPFPNREGLGETRAYGFKEAGEGVP